MKEKMIYKERTGITEGVSQSGNAWRKVTGIFETVGDYPRTIAVTAMNANCQRVLELQPGKVYEVNFDIKSREFNGKWYTDVNAWAINDIDVEVGGPRIPDPKPKAVQTSMRLTEQPYASEDLNTIDDLPF